MYFVSVVGADGWEPPFPTGRARITPFPSDVHRPPSVSVRSGHEVTLPCVINNQNNCDGTTWFFRDSAGNPVVQLIELGQIVENVGVKSDRLSVTENCSLVIKKVTDEDAGVYVCQKSVTSLHSVVLLSVVSCEYFHHHVFSSNCET